MMKNSRHLFLLLVVLFMSLSSKASKMDRADVGSSSFSALQPYFMVDSTLKGTSTGPEEPLFVYNNWASYDELSDNIPLNEALAMRELDEVVRLKKSGVKIDYYLMDAFWFDLDGGYRTWKPDGWPDGPKNWLEGCRKAGVKPGLWFSSNLLKIGSTNTMKVIDEWKDSASEDGSIMCLFQGGYLKHLMETLQLYADMGIEMFKFDFAYFDAITPGLKGTLPVNEIIERNKNAFLEALKEFRRKNPHVMLIGYNGFGGDMENTVTDFRKSVDMRWLEVFDTMYSGDPRLSDVPMMNFWRSQDLYSDHMTRQFEFNGVPVRRIDNCAFMIGKTGTCYNRALNAWKGSLALMMARGGWMNVCHGNLELLSEQDVHWFAKTQQLYLALQRANKITSFGEIPGFAKPYGYRAENRKGVVYTVVNASQSTAKVTLPDAFAGKGRILFTDSGFRPVLKGNTIILGSEQMAIVGYGDYSGVEYDLGLEKEIVSPASVAELPSAIEILNGKEVRTQITPEKGKGIRIVFQQLDDVGKPFRSWGGAPPDGKPMDEFFVIKAEQAGNPLPLKMQYDKKIWCGLSWAVAEIPAEALQSRSLVQIRVSTRDGDSRRVKLMLYSVKYD